MKSIIVTGASSGIGEATARHFLENGWTTGLLARSADKLEALAQGFDNAVVLPCDVSDPEGVESAFDAFAAQAGRLDMLFNNAGMLGVAGPIDEVPVDSWLQVVNVNLTGMFLCARQAFKIMRHQSPQGGRIVNNGSISAHVPRPGSVSYTTTKHAITGLTRTLSLDGRDFNIACGQIDIGNARTEMVVKQHARDRAAGREPDASMDVMNVAKALMYMGELSLDANVQFMTVMAKDMPYIGRG
ncbi:MAG: SDR family oxidoreductase [Pseudomonadota bacterium]